MPISVPPQTSERENYFLPPAAALAVPPNLASISSSRRIRYSWSSIVMSYLRMERLAADLSSHFKVLGFLFLAIDLLLRTLFLVKLRRFDDRSLGFRVRAL